MIFICFHIHIIKWGHISVIFCSLWLLVAGGHTESQPSHAAFEAEANLGKPDIYYNNIIFNGQYRSRREHASSCFESFALPCYSTQKKSTVVQSEYSSQFSGWVRCIIMIKDKIICRTPPSILKIGSILKPFFVYFVACSWAPTHRCHGAEQI